MGGDSTTALLSADGPSVVAEAKPIRLSPMMLPIGYDDLSRVVGVFSIENLERVLAEDWCEGAVYGAVGMTFDTLSESDPLRGRLVDEEGRALPFQCPDAAGALRRYAASRRPGQKYLLFGVLRSVDGKPTLIAPEPVSANVCKRPRPQYNVSQRTIDAQIRNVVDLEESYLAETRALNVLRMTILDRLEENVRGAVQTIMSTGLKTNGSIVAALGEEAISAPRLRLAEIVRRAHVPRTVGEGLEACRQLDRVAAVCMMAPGVEAAASARLELEKRDEKALRLSEKAREMGYAAYAKHLSAVLPFPATDEQLQAVIECLSDIDSGLPLRGMLLGDVGTGKTAVYGLISLAVIEAGGRVAVLLPSVTLARQIHRNLSSWIKGVKIAFVAGECEAADADAQLCIGTTKMRGHTAGSFDLSVVDEQQKYGRGTRESLMASVAHLLEVTATCIPRSQALVETGQIRCFRLQHCHVKKEIRSRVLVEREWDDLIAGVNQTLGEGGQVAVVYPAIEGGLVRVGFGSQSREIELMGMKRHIEWWTTHYPGLVRWSNGDCEEAENDEALLAMARGDARILLSTTMIEVGVDLPGLRRIAIMQADRFGLSQLHQLRGRVARAGGVGHCDLYLLDSASDRAHNRLDYFCGTTDGFALASYDLEDRKGGDVSEIGHRQKGTMPGNPFPDREIGVAEMDAAVKALSDQYFGEQATWAMRIYSGTT